MTVNELIQSACEDVNLVEDGEAVSGELASVAEGLLNRAITDINQDGFLSCTVKEYDRVSAGSIVFRKLEEGEEQQPNCVDSEPPDSVQGVSRKVGIRWLRLTPASPEDLAASNTFSLPQLYCYTVDTETAPSGKQRVVGVLKLNGSNPVELKVFVNSRLPKYKLGDTIYLSDLYHNLILYALEVRLCKRYKLYSYIEQAKDDLTDAKDSIDRNTLVNRPLTNIDNGSRGYMDDYYNGLGGVGL